jgi:ubiquinone/menaquinone biosynthesis C-methylase UbiE
MGVSQDAVTTSREDAGRHFDARAARYDRIYDDTSADGYALRSRMQKALDAAGDGPGDALDVGMGPGRLCAALAECGWTVSGVDASREMVAVARTRLPAASERLLQGQTELLPFADATFDLVTATGVLEYSDLRPALAEIARLLRPGGRAVVSYPNPRAVYAIWKTRLWYPAARGAKRILGRPNPTMPRGAAPRTPFRFEDELRRVGLVPDSRRESSFLPALTPLEIVLRGPVIRLGERLERGGGRLRARLFATQFVYAAHKPHEATS